MDSTGYTERQAAKNKKLLEQILSEIHSLKTAVSEIRIQLAKQNQIETKLKNGEVLANTNEGWFWFS